jgi:hypothetical protein
MIGYAAAVGVGPSARAADGVYIPGYTAASPLTGGSVQVQGSSGRLTVPLTFQGAPVVFSQAPQVAGATSSGNIGYTLITPFTSIYNSSLVLNDLSTGAYLGTVQLDHRFSDIAYTNGQLYGVGTSSTSLQLSTIGANGTSQVVVNQTTPSSSNTWRLSGVVGGSGLLAARGTFDSTNTPGFVINPQSLAVSQIALDGTAQRTLDDTVINTPGNAVTALVGQQPQTSFPGGVALGNRSFSSWYGQAHVSNTVSDEFNFNYQPTLPGVMQTKWNATITPLIGVTDGLTRTPQVVTASGPVSISNYIAPDGTTLSNVNVTNQTVQQPATGQPFGHASWVTSVQNVAPGDLSNRVVGQVSASLDLATADRGLYSISDSPTTTADYSYGTSVDHDRTVQTSGAFGTQFYYEPPSANLVGNGDAYLNNVGWQGMGGSVTTFTSQWVNSDPSNHSFYLLPSATYPAAMRQFLQEPTPNSPLLLSFTYYLGSLPSGGSDELQVYLDNTLVADLAPSSTSLQTFQTELDDPSFQNVSNPLLMFRTTSTAASSNYVYIGNISLSGVPEPTNGWLLLSGAAASLLHRRRRRVPLEV